jgi:hypothetical protein
MCNLLPHGLPMIYDEQLLTFCWHSLSWWGREGIANWIAYEGSQHFFYSWVQRIGGVISLDIWPKIVDAPLKVIFPWLHPQYAIIQFGTVHYSHCFGCLSGSFIYLLLDHYVVLYEYIDIYNNNLQNSVSFGQCSLSVAGSLNPLLWSSIWLLAALPHNR